MGSNPKKSAIYLGNCHNAVCLQRLKPTYFETFLNGVGPEFFLKTLILALKRNRATTRAHMLYYTLFPFLTHRTLDIFN